MEKLLVPCLAKNKIKKSHFSDISLPTSKRLPWFLQTSSFYMCIYKAYILFVFWLFLDGKQSKTWDSQVVLQPHINQPQLYFALATW